MPKGRFVLARTAPFGKSKLSRNLPKFMLIALTLLFRRKNEHASHPRTRCEFDVTSSMASPTITNGAL